MAGVPKGWTRIDAYAIQRGTQFICRVTVGGELWFELSETGRPGILHRAKSADSGLAQCLELANELREAA